MNNKTIKKTIAIIIGISLCMYYTKSDVLAVMGAFIFSLSVADISEKILNKGSLSWIGLVLGGYILTLLDDYVIAGSIVAVSLVVVLYVYDKWKF